MCQSSLNIARRAGKSAAVCTYFYTVPYCLNGCLTVWLPPLCIPLQEPEHGSQASGKEGAIV